MKEMSESRRSNKAAYASAKDDVSDLNYDSWFRGRHAGVSKPFRWDRHNADESTQGIKIGQVHSDHNNKVAS